ALAEMKNSDGFEANHKHPRNLFTQPGLTYMGPVDGQDLAEVEHALAQAREIRGPVLVHAMTPKASVVVITQDEQHEYAHTVTASAPGGIREQAAAVPTRVSDIFGA